MFDTLFQAVTDGTSQPTSIDFATLAACMLCAIALGITLGIVYMVRGRYTKSLVVTLALLPAVVAVVIMMVNGNLGAGVAVAGAFSLVRFRSAPGSAKDIAFVFLAMAIGLCCGMGQLAYAAFITGIMSIAYLLLVASGFGQAQASPDRTLRVTVPEDLDYTGLLDDLFATYTSYHELVSVRTANMGSLYRLQYDVGLARGVRERDFINEIRCRNGNLEVSLARQEAVHNEL